MIYTVVEGMVNVRAETLEESTKLLRVVVLGIPEDVVVPVKKIHRRQKRHVFKKKCFRCGDQFKGKLGLAVHMSTHKKQDERDAELPF